MLFHLLFIIKFSKIIKNQVRRTKLNNWYFHLKIHMCYHFLISQFCCRSLTSAVYYVKSRKIRVTFIGLQFPNFRCRFQIAAAKCHLLRNGYFRYFKVVLYKRVLFVNRIPSSAINNVM